MKLLLLSSLIYTLVTSISACSWGEWQTSPKCFWTNTKTCESHVSRECSCFASFLCGDLSRSHKLGGGLTCQNKDCPHNTDLHPWTAWSEWTGVCQKVKTRSQPCAPVPAYNNEGKVLCTSPVNDQRVNLDCAINLAIGSFFAFVIFLIGLGTGLYFYRMWSFRRMEVANERRNQELQIQTFNQQAGYNYANMPPELYALNQSETTREC